MWPRADTKAVQAAADKTARRAVRIAFKNGSTVPYSLARLLELGVSLRVVRAVYRGDQ